MDTEQRIPAQHFHISILEVEGVMRSHGCGIDRGFVGGGVCNGEVWETSDADGRRLGNGSYGDRVHFWGGDWIEWRGLRLGDPKFDVSTRESKGCDNWSCSRASLVYPFLFPGREYRWRREALPAATPQLD